MFQNSISFIYFLDFNNVLDSNLNNKIFESNHKTTHNNDIDDIFNSFNNLGASNNVNSTNEINHSIFNNNISNKLNENAFDIFSQDSKKAADFVIYEKNELKIILEPFSNQSASKATDEFQIKMIANNIGLKNIISDFLFSAAAPKSMQLKLSQPSKNNILPLEALSQTISIINPQKVNKKNLILKITYF